MSSGKWWPSCLNINVLNIITDYAANIYTCTIYTLACMDYMDRNVRCPQKAVKLNHSLTRLKRPSYVHVFALYIISQHWNNTGFLKLLIFPETIVTKFITQFVSQVKLSELYNEYIYRWNELIYLNFVRIAMQFFMKCEWPLVISHRWPCTKWVSPLLTVWRYHSLEPGIGSDNGLAPFRRQAIIWTIADRAIDMMISQFTVIFAVQISENIQQFLYARRKPDVLWYGVVRPSIC